MERTAVERLFASQKLAKKASQLDDNANLCETLLSLIELFQPRHGHVPHRQLLVMRNMLCMSDVGQYGALPAFAFGGYFSAVFCNKNQGIYAVDFWSSREVTATRGTSPPRKKHVSD